MTSPLFSTPTPPAKPAPEAPALDLDLAEIPDMKLEVMPRANGVARFAPLVASLPDAEARAASLAISDDDTDETIALKSADARRLRLDGFRAVRLEAAKVHKELKSGINEIAKQLDGAEREIRQRCERTEDALMEIERYADTRAEERRRALRAERAKQINPFLTAAPSVDLAEMSEEEFASALTDAKELHELREARAKAAEEARVKAEQEAEERRKEEERKREEERIRLQQEAEAARAKLEEAQARLKAEREAAAAEQKRRDAEADAERARLAEEARQIAIERERVAGLARAAKAKADAEAAAAARQQEQEAEAARRAAAAPDAEKVKALRQRLIDMPLPRTDNNKVFQACDRAVKLATDELARIIAKLEGGAA